jgi:lysozyme
MNHKKLADQLIKHEGLRLKPYHCPAGKHTIGVGRNLEDKGITEKEAVILLENDENSLTQCK